MEVSPLTMDDQTDEDFFDKLVDDDEDVGGGNGGGGGGDGCKVSFSGNAGSNDEQVFENLGIEEVGSTVDGLDIVDRVEGDGSGKSDSNDVVSRDLSDGKGDDMGGSVVGSQEAGDEKCSLGDVSGNGETDLSVCGSGLNVSSGIEEVEGSVFSGGTRKASFSNYFNQIDDDSPDPFADLVGDSMVASASVDSVPSNEATCSTSSYGFGENEGDFQQGSFVDSNNAVVDQNSIEYWESLYPGWKFDRNTGQWVGVTGLNMNNVEISNGSVQATYEGYSSNPTSDVSYLHYATQPAVTGSMSEESTTGASMYWNQTAYGSTEYPAHMVFDPNYPGWYYDTIAQEWRSLEFYFQSINQSASFDQSQQLPYQSTSALNNYSEQKNLTYSQSEQVDNYSYELNQPVNMGDFGKETSNVTQINNNTQYENGFTSNGAVSYSSDHETGAAAYQNSFSSEQLSRSLDSSIGFNRFQSFGVDNAALQNFDALGNTLQPDHRNTLQPNHSNNVFNHQFSSISLNSPNPLNFSQQPHQNSSLSNFSSKGRSIDGRPPHALVSFGFGGKLVVMKHQSSLHTQPVYASQDSAGGVISILNVIELAMPRNDGSHAGFSDCDYIRTLCQQSFSSPLVSGNVGNKEVNKWIDDRIANCGDTQDANYRKGEVLKMVLSLLKIACQFYGKLRSPFGADHSSKENDCPESALAKLFSSAKRDMAQFSAVSHCLQNMPPEGQAQATAEQVQMLLVSGRRMEALQCAQQGHLWGLAIVIATLLGDQFYGETVKQMALHQLVAGSPLRTLCLLIAGQPAEVFSNSVASSTHHGVTSQSSWVGPGCMLDAWEENLAVISANRTNGDELVITHLGDCLWKEKDEVMAAHICYLVAEANLESYSESARLCLVGADHLKYPRTYASPQAIQRTELYEYAKVLGNSQFVLLPFQPYKIMYACMLAEVGKLSDSLKYCQAVTKSLRTGRSPEADTWRHMISSLEERIKIHQQGGYGTNFGGAKLVGKLLNFFDNTAHRVVGGVPPSISSASISNGQHNEHDHLKGPRVSTSQSTMAMSSLMTSASAEDSNGKALHNRSMSEPNFGRTPGKEESPKSSSSSSQNNASASAGPSRLGRFGSQILQKTVGLVLRARPDRQAKLGETNKFYYDEKLKRWVEEGAESQVEEMTLAPPPTTAAFIDGKLDHDRKNEYANSMVYANGESESKHTNYNGKTSDLPPIPSAVNHFSARGRMGVRSRYVDTFNKGGGSQANSFRSPTPSLSAMKSPPSNHKFFIPTPAAAGQEADTAQNPQQNRVADNDSAPSNGHDSYSSPQMLTPVSTIGRNPSMDKEMDITGNSNGPLPLSSRRTLSWNGGPDMPNHDTTNNSEITTSGSAPGFY